MKKDTISPLFKGTILEDGYGFVPRLIMRCPIISTGAKGLYCYLLSLSGDKGRAFPHVSTIMRELAIGKKAYTNYVNQLLNNNILLREQNKHGSKYGTNTYRLILRKEDLPQFSGSFSLKLQENINDSKELLSPFFKDTILEDGYGFVPRFIMRNPNVSIEAKAIYGYFMSFAGNRFVAFPGRETIVKEMNLSSQTYDKYMRVIKELSMILVSQHKNKGRFSNNIYTITLLKSEITIPNAISKTIENGGFLPLSKKAPAENETSPFYSANSNSINTNTININNNYISIDNYYNDDTLTPQYAELDKVIHLMELHLPLLKNIHSNIKYVESLLSKYGYEFIEYFVTKILSMYNVESISYIYKCQAEFIQLGINTLEQLKQYNLKHLLSKPTFRKSKEISNTVINKDINYNEVFNIFLSTCTNMPNICKYTILNDEIKMAITTLFKSCTIEDFINVCSIINSNEWLNSVDNTIWFDLLWILKPQNFKKILNHKYDKYKTLNTNKKPNNHQMGWGKKTTRSRKEIIDRLDKLSESGEAFDFEEIFCKDASNK